MSARAGRVAPGALRRVLLVNTTDSGGGAERMAVQVLDGMLERGLDAALVVRERLTDHPRVVEINASPNADAPGKIGRRVWNSRREADRLLGREDFAFPSTRWLLDAAGERPDVLLAFNLHGGYFDLTQLPEIAARVPTVLRLADSWLFTGHCAVPRGCGRWEHGCGSCPDLSIPPAIIRDRTAPNWRRKRRLFAGTSVEVVAASRWLVDRAQRSLMAEAIAGAHVIPSGVDLGVFRPGPGEEVRQRLGIPPSASMALYVANGGLGNPYKDGTVVRAAARTVAASRPVELVVVGGGVAGEEADESLGVRHLPWMGEPAELADLYRAADVLLHAAPEETFCLTAAEALACGTPVVAAAGGGLAEVVEDGVTGLLVPPGHTEGLATALERVLGDPGLRRTMGERAAESARLRFGREPMIDRYVEVCEGVLERRALAA